jgi:hypothetical protein
VLDPIDWTTLMRMWSGFGLIVDPRTHPG